MVNSLHAKTWSGRPMVAPLLGLGLLSLVFLGSPGCGCGDTFPTRISPSPCCCTINWAAPRTDNLSEADIRVVIVSQSAGLGAIASPSLFNDVDGGDVLEFLLCVEQDHPIGAFLQLELREVGSNTLWGSASVVYKDRCRAEIDPSGETLIWTDDCGQVPDCCCNFVWIPEQTNLKDATVDIVVIDEDAGLNAEFLPSTLVGVTSGEMQMFTVCVDVDHPLGASIQVEFRIASGMTTVVEELGSFTLDYDERCVPTITEGARTTVYSPDCGTVPQCCCDYEWIPDLTDVQGATVDIVITNQTPGLNATITPPTLTGVNFGEPQAFTICVDADHPDSALLEITFEDAGTVEPMGLGNFTLEYQEPCEPLIIEGFQTIVYSPDCGGIPRCCCDLHWTNLSSTGGFIDVRVEFVNVDPSLNPTAAPPVVTGIGIEQVAVFTICVDISHDPGAQMGIRIMDNNSNQEVAFLPVIYNNRCFPEMGDPSGNGFFQIFCDDNGPTEMLTED